MKIIYSQDAIQTATRDLARALNADYKGQEIHLVGVLKGAFIFMADLVRHLDGPCTVDFVRLSSYVGGTRSTGTVREMLGLSEDLAGRHVVVVEEIVDSGTTLAALLKHLEAQRPASLKVCALVDKTGRRETEVPVHYRGFHLDDGFVVGYGLDFDERYRNLPFIGVLEAHEQPL